MSVSSKMLLNVAKSQGYKFYRFWVIKGKPTEWVKLSITFSRSPPTPPRPILPPGLGLIFQRYWNSVITSRITEKWNPRPGTLNYNQNLKGMKFCEKLAVQKSGLEIQLMDTRQIIFHLLVINRDWRTCTKILPYF